MDIFKSHQSKITSLQELSGYRIGIHKGSTADSFITNLGFVTLGYDNIDDAINMLSEGTIDAIVADKSILMYQASRKQGMTIEVLTDLVINKEFYGYAFPLNSPLKKQIDYKILEYVNNGKIDSIKQYYGVVD